jgi:hypothetical protein
MPSWMSACVPTTMRAAPSASAAVVSAALRRGQAAGQQRDLDAQRPQQLGHPARVLLGEDLRGCHEHGLVASLEGEQHGEERHHRLARADVSLEQPAHTPGGLHVRVDLAEHARLRFRERERQGLVESTDELVGAHVLDPWLELGSPATRARLHELQEE